MHDYSNKKGEVRKQYLKLRSERLQQRCPRKEIISVCEESCEDELVEIPSQEQIDAAEGLLPKTFS
ncbi:hypothetical protein NQ317_001073 [Molorchus minor]|uniref:Uncharacterized protein n=1 Tax=Molorchus minor TaxID=1323400 RepID=A0ABQ9JPZ3_9CUCU|nr:hypothetical protein NQ317_001073 [Molorchus minor]